MQHTMWARGCALLMIAGLLIAGCVPAPLPAPAAVEAPVPTEAAPSVEATEPAEAAPALEAAAPAETAPETAKLPRGGVMTAAFDQGPGGTGGNLDAWSTQGGRLWFDMYLGKLVTYSDITLTELSGDLAESWDVSPDGLVYTFHLRPGLTWHDGEPFTAADVKWSLDAVSTPGVSMRVNDLNSIEGFAALREGQATGLSGVEVVDDSTVRVTLSEPDASFLANLTLIYIMPQHAMQDIPLQEIPNNPWWQTAPVGIGPFKFVRHEPGQYTELERFEGYWRGAPRLERLINRYYPEPGAAARALEAGEIDFTYVSLDEMLRLKENPEIEILSRPSWVLLSFGLNMRLPVFQDLRVRQALLYAIDRQGIRDNVMQGTAELVHCLYSLPQWLPDDLNPYPYDPAKARQLLDEAGFDYSQEFEILTSWNDQQTASMLEAFQQYWADVGVKATVRVVDAPTLSAELRAADPKWSIFYAGAGIGPDPDFPRNFFICGAEVPKGTNFGGYCVPALDTAFQAGRSALTQEARDEAYREVCRQVNQNLPGLPLFEPIRYGATNGRIGNFVWTPTPGWGRYYSAAETWYVKELEGEVEGAYYKIVMPDPWNGDLVIYNHGQDVNPLAPVTNLGSLAEVQLAEGYAVAASSFRTPGWALFETTKDLEALVGVFEQNYGTPRQVFLYGHSMGGLVTVQGIEQADLGNVVGALPLCGALGGPPLWGYVLDGRLIYDVICEGVEGAAIPGGAGGLPAGEFLPFPEVQQRVDACFGIVDPQKRTPEQAERLALYIEASTYPESLVVNSMFMQTNSLSRLIHDPDKSNGRLPFGNLRVQYPNDFINENIARVGADPAAARRFHDAYTPTGQVGDVKIITLQTDKDGLVPIESESYYAALVPASNFTPAVVVEEVASHCGFKPAEEQAAWEALRAWVAGGPQPTAATIQDLCQDLVAQEGSPEGPCRIDPGFELPDVNVRFPLR